MVFLEWRSKTISLFPTLSELVVLCPVPCYIEYNDERHDAPNMMTCSLPIFRMFHGVRGILQVESVKIEPSLAPPRVKAPWIPGRSSDMLQVRTIRLLPALASSPTAISQSPKRILPRPKGRLYHVIQFGNNSMMLRSMLRARPWLQPLATYDVKTGEESHRASSRDATANFVWTQFKSQDYLDAAFAGCRVKIGRNTETGLNVLQGRKDADAPVTSHNHFEGVAWMCTKRGLLETLGGEWQPRSFILRKNDDFEVFAESFNLQGEDGIWILKPSEFSNRGNGIEIMPSKQLAVEFLRKNHPGAWVVQKYIEKPMLLDSRKFDIRSYGLICSQDGENFKSYFYPIVYVRTASDAYSLQNIQNKFAHLNNDAVQKHCKNYGKIENCNKLSLPQLEKKLKGEIESAKVTADIKKITGEVFKACAPRLNPRKIPRCFEVVGFDFMLDSDAKVWLIEANTNPCLELVNALLAQLIPNMIDGALKLTIDQWIGGFAAPTDVKWEEL